jgi:hypothetical protein
MYLAVGLVVPTSVKTGFSGTTLGAASGQAAHPAVGVSVGAQPQGLCREPACERAHGLNEEHEDCILVYAIEADLLPDQWDGWQPLRR